MAKTLGRPWRIRCAVYEDTKEETINSYDAPGNTTSSYGRYVVRYCVRFRLLFPDKGEVAVDIIPFLLYQAAVLLDSASTPC
jgi:hypothetical protein